jgi:uncharacterized protein (DUF2344 family)
MLCRPSEKEKDVDVEENLPDFEISNRAKYNIKDRDKKFNLKQNVVYQKSSSRKSVEFFIACPVGSTVLHSVVLLRPTAT